MQVVEAFNTQFRLRLIAALKKEFKRLTGGTEGVTSISTAKLGEEEGMTKAIAEGADDGGRAARKSEKVCGTLHRNAPWLDDYPCGLAQGNFAQVCQALSTDHHHKPP